MYVDLLIVAIVAAGLMVGNELTVAAFLHPTLRQTQDSLHAPLRRSFATLFGRVMPFWYAAVFLLTAGAAWTGPPHSSLAGELLLASSILWLLAIVFSLISPAPLNKRIAQWQLEKLPANWRDEAARWDRMHAARMFLLLAALICLVAGGVIRS